MSKQQDLITLAKQAIEHNKRANEYLETILSELGFYNPQDDKVPITDIRRMESMKMIEDIIESGRASYKNVNFAQGLKDHLLRTRRLTESQRFHLESTYNKIFGD